MASGDIGRMRADLEPFHSELMEEYFRNLAGHSQALNTAPIFDKYSYMFSRETCAELRESLAASEEPEDGRQLRHLRTFSTFGLLRNETSELADGAGNFESRTVLDVDGESIPYRAVAVRLANEADARTRQRVFRAKTEAMDGLNALLLDKVRTFQTISAELGYRNYCHLCSDLKGIDYFRLEEAMARMLRRTDRLYEDAMSDLFEARLGMPMSEGWSYDVPHLMRGGIYDGIFEKDRMMQSFSATLETMGLDPRNDTNITVDADERPNKSSRAFCAPVKVPDDVRLVIRPSGGWRDYETFFHEGGHAWHFGHTDRGLPAEFRYLGDNSVTETFAFLFNYLPTNPEWLNRYLNVDNPDEFVRFASAGKLYFLRRYASKLIYELKLFGAGITEELQDVYKVHLQKGLGIRHSERAYLEDVDDEFYCADYLRAWMLEGQLRMALEEKFGESWFEDEGAGRFLSELWSYGQKFSAEELANTLGFVELDMEETLDRIEAVLAR